MVNNSLQEVIYRELRELQQIASLPKIIDLFSNYLIGKIDPKILSFSKLEKRKAQRVSKELEKVFPGNILTIQKAIIRKPFLYGVNIFFRRQENSEAGVECRIIGFGLKKGNTTHIHKILVEEGTEKEVYSDPNVKRAIGSHLQEGGSHQVILVHNHIVSLRRIIKNFLVGEIPVTSTYDRNCAWRTFGENFVDRLFKF